MSGARRDRRRARRKGQIMTIHFVNDGKRKIAISGREGDHYFDNIASVGGANRFLMRCIGRLRQKASVFDVGANIGFTSALFAKNLKSASIYSFEPSRDAYPYLIETLRINDITNCRPINLALGRQAGEVLFSEDHNSASASHLAIDSGALGERSYSVEITTIDDFVRRNNIEELDFIKIDVEGLELDVLKGAEDTISRLRPTVFVEFNSFTLIAYGNLNPRRLIEHLLETFPHVYMFKDGAEVEIRSSDSVLSFIHENLVHNGCVDDLLCSYDKL
jgi:FkbM family methyltransferase